MCGSILINRGFYTGTTLRYATDDHIVAVQSAPLNLLRVADWYLQDLWQFVTGVHTSYARVFPTTLLPLVLSTVAAAISGAYEIQGSGGDAASGRQGDTGSQLALQRGHRSTPYRRAPPLDCL